MLTGQGSAVTGDECARRDQEVPEDAAAAGLVERPIDPHVHASVTEVPVRQAGDVEFVHQGVEVAEVVAEHGRRHCRVLPPCVRGQAGRTAAGESGTIGADPPQLGGTARVGDHEAVHGSAVPSDLLRPGDRLVEVVADDLDEQPGRPGRQRRNRIRAAALAHDVDDPGIDTLAGGRIELQHQRGRVTRRRDVGVPQHDQDAVGGLGHQADCRAGCHREGALRADQHAGHVEPILRQQVFQGVSGHLTAELPELGADGRQTGAGDLLQCTQRRGGRHLAGRTQLQRLPGSGQNVQALHVVRGPAVSERARTAGIVSDHAADGASSERRWVGPESQALRCDGPLQHRLNRARLDGGGLCVPVDRQHPVHVPAEVENQSGPDSVTRNGGAATARGQRHALSAAHREGGSHLVGMARPRDDQRSHPVQGRIGRIGSAGGAVGENVAHSRTAQLSGQ